MLILGDVVSNGASKRVERKKVHICGEGDRIRIPAGKGNTVNPKEENWKNEGP